MSDAGRCGHFRRFSRVNLPFLFASLFLFSACHKAAEPAADAPVHAHVHHPPHGGTPVVLGDEAYHIELVRDPVAGKLDAYVLDGEMEEFVRIAQPSIECAVTVGNEQHALVLKAVADRASGETVGDTSYFEAEESWLKTTSVFDGVFKKLQVKGTNFSNVTFNFPKGNDRD